MYYLQAGTRYIKVHSYVHGLNLNALLRHLHKICTYQVEYPQKRSW